MIKMFNVPVSEEYPDGRMYVDCETLSDEELRDLGIYEECKIENATIHNLHDLIPAIPRMGLSDLRDVVLMLSKIAIYDSGNSDLYDVL